MVSPLFGVGTVRIRSQKMAWLLSNWMLLWMMVSLAATPPLSRLSQAKKHTPLFFVDQKAIRLRRQVGKSDRFRKRWLQCPTLKGGAHWCAGQRERLSF